MSLRICVFVFKPAFVEELQYSQKNSDPYIPHGTIIFFERSLYIFCIKKAEKSCANYNLFIFCIYNYLLGQSLYTCFDKYVCVHRKNLYDCVEAFI